MVTGTLRIRIVELGFVMNAADWRTSANYVDVVYTAPLGAGVVLAGRMEMRASGAPRIRGRACRFRRLDRRIRYSILDDWLIASAIGANDPVVRVTHREPPTKRVPAGVPEPNAKPVFAAATKLIALALRRYMIAVKRANRSRLLVLSLRIRSKG